MKNLGWIVFLAITTITPIIGLDQTSTQPFTKQQEISSENEYDLPIRLKIPKLEIDTQVEQVGHDIEGNMAVARDEMNVAWYKYGYIPGQIGNAVIAGHLDDEVGPAVFAYIDKLDIGDEVLIETAQGKTLKFRVVRKEVYQDSNFPIQEVFSNSVNKNLNLITCTGEFSILENNYSDRLVVFTTLVD